jgi:succinate dehydrogenase/fumarate reductase flavoprotein subunit
MKISSDYDVVVLGAGAGGMTAACVAAAEGLRVVLIEKSPFVGGTTAVSGGMVWIPANSKATQAGKADTTERARLYLEQTVRGSFNENSRRVPGKREQGNCLSRAQDTLRGMPSNTGDGIELARLAGGRVWDRNTENAFWTPVSHFVRRDGSEGIFPHTVTDRAKPGAIAVNRRGLRFTNEAISYHEFVRAMLQARQGGPSIPAYLICDRRFLWKYGLGAVKPFSVSLRAHIKSGYLTTGQTVRALAHALGIDADRLEASIRRFNDGAREGVDRDFGRGGMRINDIWVMRTTSPIHASRPSSMPLFIRSPSIPATSGP